MLLLEFLFLTRYSFILILTMTNSAYLFQFKLINFLLFLDNKVILTQDLSRLLLLFIILVLLLPKASFNAYKLVLILLSLLLHNLIEMILLKFKLIFFF
jgi:hypothetical protein